MALGITLRRPAAAPARSRSLTAAAAAAAPARSRSLTAAAMRVKQHETQNYRRLVQPWQHRALAYYESLGEINFSAQFYARTLSKIRYFPAVLDDNGDPQESEDPKLLELWDRVQDPGGGRSRITTTYGQLQFLCGECYLVCSPDDDWGEKWEILSVAELRISADGHYQRVVAPGLAFEELIAAPDDEFEPVDNQVIVYRLYKPDPRFSKLSDAPMRGVLTLCEELVLLDLAVRAQVKQRASKAGIMFIAEEISPPPPDATDDDPMADPFFRDLFNMFMEPIANPGSASAAMPNLVRVAKEFVKQGEGWDYLSLNDPQMQIQELAQREATIKRIAIGLDFPPEQLLGLTDSNHWSGWLVDEQSWKAHLMPVTQRFCDDFTSSYLRPAAKQEGIADWQRVTIGYDAAEVINHPDKAKDAHDAYQNRVVGKAYYRAAIGAEDADAPTKDELNEMIGVAVRDGSLALYGIPSVKAGGIEPEPGIVESPAGESSAPAGPPTGAEVEKGPPEGGPPEPRTASAAEAINPTRLLEAARLVGAAEYAVERAREVAGNRIRNRAKGCEPCLERIGAAVSSLVAAALGAEQTAGLLNGSATERDLVAGTAESFAIAAVRVGVEQAWAAELGDLVETHAARTLYDAAPPPLPANFGAAALRACSRQTLERAA